MTKIEESFFEALRYAADHDMLVNIQTYKGKFFCHVQYDKKIEGYAGFSHNHSFQEQDLNLINLIHSIRSSTDMILERVKLSQQVDHD